MSKRKTIADQISQFFRVTVSPVVKKKQEWYATLNPKEKIGVTFLFVAFLFGLGSYSKEVLNSGLPFLPNRSKDCGELAKKFLRASYDYAIEHNEDYVKEAYGGLNGVALKYTIDSQGNISSETIPAWALVKKSTGLVHGYVDSPNAFFISLVGFRKISMEEKGFRLEKTNMPFLTKAQIEEIDKRNQMQIDTLESKLYNKPLIESGNAITCKIGKYRVEEMDNKIYWTKLD